MGFPVFLSRKREKLECTISGIRGMAAESARRAARTVICISWIG